MPLYVSNFLDHLESLHGREFETVFQKKKFTLLFHDTTKLRFRIEHRDISVPLSILLLAILRLITHKCFDGETSIHLLGKDWGYGYIAKMLLECDDVELDPEIRGLALVRIPKRKNGSAPLKRPEIPSVAVNPNGNGRAKAIG